MSLPDSEIAARMARLARLDEERELERSFHGSEFDLMGDDHEDDPEAGSDTGLRITPEDRLRVQFGNRFQEVNYND
jgi:hypothetical protein